MEIANAMVSRYFVFCCMFERTRFQAQHNPRDALALYVKVLNLLTKTIINASAHPQHVVEAKVPHHQLPPYLRMRCRSCL